MYTHKNGIILRKMDHCDLSLLLNLKQESWFGTHTIAIINSSDQLRWFEAITQSLTSMIMIAETSSAVAPVREPVGVYKISNIDWISRRFDSAHDVFDGHRGKGFGKTVLEAGVDFAFEVLNMHRLDTEVLANNLASIKTAEFVGYQREGCRRRAIHKCGEWIDSILFGILREEWTQLPRVKNYGGVCNVSYKPKDGTR